jgi:hypothetical protein
MRNRRKIPSWHFTQVLQLMQLQEGSTPCITLKIIQRYQTRHPVPYLGSKTPISLIFMHVHFTRHFVPCTFWSSTTSSHATAVLDQIKYSSTMFLDWSDCSSSQPEWDLTVISAMNTFFFLIFSISP